MARTRTFTRENKEELEKMFELRRQGWSLSAIGLLYNKDHTTIVYHCKKHGVVPLVEMVAPGVVRPIVHTPKPPGKYDHLFDEVINRGKLYYVDYLISAGINPQILSEPEESSY